MAKHNDRAQRPTACAPDFAIIPEALRQHRHWVLWRFDWSVQRGEWAKVPYQPTGKHAKSNDKETWHSFESCMTAFEQARSSYDGIGFVFSKAAPYVGVDLDNCVTDETGEMSLTPFAVRVMDKLGTYTELSPSLKGLHLIGEASEMQALKTKWNGNDIEVYRNERYFTFTGRSWHESALPVKEITLDLTQIADACRKPEQQKNGNGIVSNDTSVEKRIEMALQNPKLESLFHGNTLPYGGDDSRADMALCSMLAYYSDNNAGILDQMFRRSKLFRGKWDERHGQDTYGGMTIAKALTGKTGFLSVRKTEQKTESSYDTRKIRRYTIDDLWEQTMDYRQSGDAQGVHPGWDELAKFYRPSKGTLSIITGEPGSGKSTVLDVLCYKIAVRHNWRITFASFETLPIQRHILNLCQIHLAKPTFAFVQDSASDSEMERARIELRDLFNFIMPDDHELNIDTILDYVDDDIRDYAIQGFVLDPFTELDQTRHNGLSQTEHIELILRRLQRFTRQRQIHSWLIAHPTKAGDTYKDGRPTLRSISGSANFYNKADFGLVAHRSEQNQTTLFVDKVRFDSTGDRGQVDFCYDKFAKGFMPKNETPAYYSNHYDKDDL